MLDKVIINLNSFCSSFRDKSDLKLPVATSFWRLVRYHLGSVAFGSFIIALVQLIRIIMQYVERKLAKKGGKIMIQFGQGLLSGEVIHFFLIGIPIRIPQEFPGDSSNILKDSKSIPYAFLKDSLRIP